MKTQYYKILNADGTPCHGGKGQWFLPNGDKPGQWMVPIKNIALCERGYHVVNIDQLIEWLGPTIWLVEIRGKSIHDLGKTVAAEARLVKQLTTWNERTARLFAADCAEWALQFWTDVKDQRPAQAIQATRDYANGIIDQHVLLAAWSAARSAAWSAARSAADSAADSSAWSAARSAARSAAWSAARSAARSAAWSAAWSTARIWQTARLKQYLFGEIT